MSDLPDGYIDAQGLLCPEPVMLLHNAMRRTETGGIVKIIATDPSTQRDIPKFCQFLGHVLVEAKLQVNAEGNTTYIYHIEKVAQADR